MITFEILNKKIYYSLTNGQASYNNQYIEYIDHFSNDGVPVVSDNTYPSLTICLQSSTQCNLECKYCFSKLKDKKLIEFENFIPYLNFIINQNLNKNRFYIDLSGEREPLLNLPFILDAVQYADEMSEKLRKEVLITFVTNGILLTKKVSTLLKSKGVLFGISLDGPKGVHDKNRPLKNGKSSYDIIIKNILEIEDKTFLGCAVTIGKQRFNLVKTIEELCQYFPTISIKPARLDNSSLFTFDDINFWKKEYERLTQILVEKALNGDLKILLAILNGDDYFGKFINRVFLNYVAYNRCDAGLGRIYLTQDGVISHCVPLSIYDKYKFDNLEHYLKEDGKSFFLQQLTNPYCFNCNLKKLCGGECAVEKENHVTNNTVLCELKKHLILLAIYLREELKLNEEVFKKVYDFCNMKMSRNKENLKFKTILNTNPQKSFAECKKIFYSTSN